MEIFEVGYIRDGRWAVMHRVGAASTEVLSALDPESVEVADLAGGAGVAVAQVRPGSRWVTTPRGWRPAPQPT